MKTNLLQNIALFAIVLFVSSCSGIGFKDNTPEGVIDELMTSIGKIDSKESAEAFAAKLVDFDGNPIVGNNDLKLSEDALGLCLDFMEKNEGYDHCECHSAVGYECTKKEFCDSVFIYSAIVYAKNGKANNSITPVLKKGDKYIALPPVMVYTEGTVKMDAESSRLFAYVTFSNLVNRESAKGAVEVKPKDDEMNPLLFGEYSNNADPNIDMTLNKEAKADPDFNNTKVYGTISVANEYFEIEYIAYITAIKADGDNIIADITVTHLEGDPEEGDFSYPVKEKTQVTIVPAYKGARIEGYNNIPSQKLVKK